MSPNRGGGGWQPTPWGGTARPIPGYQPGNVPGATFGSQLPNASGGGIPWGQIGQSALGAGLGAAITYGLGRIPGLGGQVVNGPQMPSDIQGLRGDVISWLRGQGQTPNIGGSQLPGMVNQQGGFGGMGPAPIFSGGSGTPTYTQSGAMTGPIRNGPPPVNRISYDVEGGRPFAGAGGLPPGGDQNYSPIPGGITTPGAPPGQGAPWEQIYSGYVGPFTGATAEGAQVGALPNQQSTTVGAAGQANYTPTQAGPAVGAGQYLDPRFSELYGLIQTLGNGMAPTQAQATAVRPVNDIASVANMVQSLDQIVNSPAGSGYFKDQILNPYRDLFSQNRGLALAQAREASGNLTGSGYANALGGVVNQLVPQENAKLADILTQLATTEQGKQQLVAEREQGRNVQNQNTDLARALEDARLATSASITNAGEGNRFNIAQMGARGELAGQFANIFGNQAQSQANAQNQTNLFNVDQTNQAGVQQAISNANAITQRAIAQGQITSAEAQNFFNAQVRREIENATLQQNANQFNAGQYNTVGMFNNQQQQGAQNFNAQQFLSLLLPLLTGGVSTGQQSYQPGFADQFAALLPYFMQLNAGRIGTGSNNSPGAAPAGTPTGVTPGNSFAYQPAPFSWQPYVPRFG